MSRTHAFRLSVFAVLMASLGACAAETPAPAPQLPPESALTQDIAASAKSTELTGVTAWKMYTDTERPEGTLVFGVDASGAVLTESRIGADLTDGATNPAVAMDALYPETGSFRLDADGKVVGRGLSASAAAVFGAFGADFKEAIGSDTMRSSQLHPRSWACFRAATFLGAECGVGAVACAGSEGVACFIGIPLCINAYYEWLCKCWDRCY
jgi:hypothetical protein